MSAVTVRFDDHHVVVGVRAPSVIPPPDLAGVTIGHLRQLLNQVERYLVELNISPDLWPIHICTDPEHPHLIPLGGAHG